VAHALPQVQGGLGSKHVQFEWNDPILIGMANRGVAATQFLYHAAARPQFMATSFGKMFTRFKQFALKSVTMRAEVVRLAKLTGYNPNTPEYKALERYVVGDLFVMSMASLFPYTIFESVLAPPWDWFADLSAFFFGSEWEKNESFLGGTPLPSQHHPAAASAERTDTDRDIQCALVTGDWERLMSREVHTWFPFGRMSHSVVRSLTPLRTRLGTSLGFRCTSPFSPWNFVLYRTTVGLTKRWILYYKWRSCSIE
jgi:hypothetical protein